MPKIDLAKELAELDKTVAKINEKYGPGFVVRAKDAAATKLTRVSSGVFSLDVELGGGLPENRIVMLNGREGCGKTTIALKMMAAALNKYPKRVGFWADAEGVWDEEWAIKNGVDVSRVMLYIPAYLEQMYDVAIAAIRNPAVCCVVLDSLVGVPAGKELEISFEDSTMGLEAKLNTRFVKKIISALWSHKNLTDANPDFNKAIILINQMRDNLGYGAPDTTPGGRALRHHPSVTITLAKDKPITEKYNGKDMTVGYNMKFKLAKNKVTEGDNVQGEFDMYVMDTNEFKAGQIDQLKQIIVYAVLWDVIVKKGGWYTIGGEDGTRVQGIESVFKHLKENPDVMMRVAQEVLVRAKERLQKEEDMDIDPDTGEPKE